MLSLYWLRQDLRVHDNPALTAALKGGPTVAVFLLDENDPWAPGGASRWWLHHALLDLKEQLAKLNVPLLLRRTKESGIALHALARELGATHIHWSRCYEPYAIARDTEIKKQLTEDSLVVESHNASLLHEPWTIKNQSGNFYRVYTPFSKACMALGDGPAPLPVPKAQAPHSISAKSDDLASWAFIPSAPDWAGDMRAAWQPTAAGAQQRLDYICSSALQNYAAQRDRPDVDQTSRLSPFLHWGQISPRHVWHSVRRAGEHKDNAGGSEKFLKELLWREFAHHLLFHQPQMPTTPLDKRYAAFPWQPEKELLHAWQRGQTGYPIVDAGMRQLWQTGWMHNRVRMICASVLVKHLLQPWQAGAAWFWDTLVDADLANNSASWQWVAGCGADAAPYFRVFNPILQGLKFDPDGTYVREFVPELRDVPQQYIHSPWEWSGKTSYPAPIITHEAGRARALDALKQLGAGSFKDED